MRPTGKIAQSKSSINYSVKEHNKRAQQKQQIIKILANIGLKSMVSSAFADIYYK